MKRAPLALTGLMVLLGCSDRAKSSDPAPAAPAFTGKPTSALIQRPEIAALVDALAAETDLESSHIGAAGSPSAVYAKFTALAEKANEAEMVALLEHRSAVVRGYSAQHVAGKLPARLEALVPLAEDATAVPTLNGCMRGLDTVGRIVIDALCYSQLPEAGGTLVTIARKGGRGASHALVCAAPTAPTIAAEAASQALRGKVTPEDEAAYLRALALAPTADPADGCALARPRATSSDASVQIGAAQALWRCDDEASRKTLVDLAGGKNTVVARHAKASLFLAFEGRRRELSTDREVVFEVRERLAQALRSPEGTRRSIGLVETLALAYPENLGAPLYRAIVLPETTAAALRIAAKTEPGKFAGWAGVRSDVVAYLARSKDPAAIVEIRRSLGSTEPLEVTAALRGIEAFKDTASRAAVEKLTTHSNREVADAAKKALTAL